MRQQKALDFYRVCCKVLQQDATGVMSEFGMVRRVMTMKAPRYYVTDEYALKVVGKVLKKKGVRRMERSAKARQWRDIVSRVTDVRTRLGVGTEEALWRVLDGEAPEFFVSAERAYRLYLQGRRIWRERSRKGGVEQ